MLWWHTKCIWDISHENCRENFTSNRLKKKNQFYKYLWRQGQISKQRSIFWGWFLYRIFPQIFPENQYFPILKAHFNIQLHQFITIIIFSWLSNYPCQSISHILKIHCLQILSILLSLLSHIYDFLFKEKFSIYHKITCEHEWGIHWRFCT